MDDTSDSSERSSSASSVDTLPTYRVHETKSGKLVNHALNVVWPQQPKNGKTLRDGYVVKNQQQVQKKSQKELQSSSKVISSESSTSSKLHSATSPARDGRRFIGPATLSEVNERLRQQDFLIFYPLPDITLDDLRVELPLLMAYRSHMDKIYYLPIRKECNLWYVFLPYGKHLGFKSMAQLIQHYLVYGFFDKNTNQIEIFPLHLLEKKNNIHH